MDDIITQAEDDREPPVTPAARPQLILGLDASTPPASVALVRGDQELGHRIGPFGPQTDAWILAAVDELMRDAGIALGDLDAIAASRGPGTFTGIRVSLAAALGLGAGSGVPVCGVGTLEALIDGAQAAVGRTGPLDILALVDARRQQHYALRAVAPAYTWPLDPFLGPVAIATEALIRDLAASPPALCVGASVPMPSQVRQVEGPPLAVSIARLAARTAAADRGPAVPVYLRAPDAVPGVSPLRRRRPV